MSNVDEIKKSLHCLKGGRSSKVVEGYEKGIWLIEKRIPRSASQTAPPLGEGDLKGLHLNLMHRNHMKYNKVKIINRRKEK